MILQIKLRKWYELGEYSVQLVGCDVLPVVNWLFSSLLFLFFLWFLTSMGGPDYDWPKRIFIQTPLFDVATSSNFCTNTSSFQWKMIECLIVCCKKCAMISALLIRMCFTVEQGDPTKKRRVERSRKYVSAFDVLQHVLICCQGSLIDR